MDKLEVVGWRYRYPGDAFWQLTGDRKQAHDKVLDVEPLTLHAPAQAEIDRLRGERDECERQLQGKTDEVIEWIDRALAAEAEVSRLTAERGKYQEALRLADQFITNGIELGYIRMPATDTPDPAHDTPAMIRARLEDTHD